MPSRSLHRPTWQRALWVGAGFLSLIVGLVGVALPVLPTVPFVLLAAYCFSRGSERFERWIVEHPRLGPPVRQWREHRAVPLRAKQFATVMMAGGSAVAWWLVPGPGPWRWLPAVVCTLVAIWLWRLPTAPGRPS
jgi:uncharacterized membrane protein YbaN (DUF454 family)